MYKTPNRDTFLEVSDSSDKLNRLLADVHIRKNEINEKKNKLQTFQLLVMLKAGHTLLSADLEIDGTGMLSMVCHENFINKCFVFHLLIFISNKRQ